ncbi:MAG TPA: hypothetical protein VFV78_07335 [Vicinamibacterales bacterium]|nr:hypothetical protein [Vicinamibacterales bacterium]
MRFRRMMMAQCSALRAGAVLLVTLVIAIQGVVAADQSPAVDAGAIFRVFLKNGTALASYGESAEAGDRVVFTLLVIGAGQQRTLQLTSLPANAVDLERTRRYADAIRLVHYTATRAELDYAAMTQEVQRSIAELTAVADPKKRLAMAEDARARLVAWSRSTYGYRAAEVQELKRLFDEVINDLRAAAGLGQFTLELSANTIPPAEALMAAPGAAESISLALAAADAADTEEDRAAILNAAAAAVAGDDPALADARASVTRALEMETRATAAYEQLASELRARAAAARKKADADALANVLSTLQARDAELGNRRPQVVRSLTSEIEAMLSSARSYRAALERYTAVRGTLLAYERTIRPTMSGFDGLVPVFTAIREIRYTAYERLERAGVRLKELIAHLETIRPPADLVDVQATLVSALRMADHACDRRRLSIALRSQVIAEEASSAAAGAMLLAGQAREQLVSRLYPPKIQ